MASYPEALNVCNAALSALGQNRLMEAVDTAAADPRDRMLALLYEGERLSVLSSHAWNFIREEERVAPYRVGGQWAFDYPSGCLLLRAVFDGDGEVPHRRIGSRVLCDRRPTVMRYLRDARDPERWDPLVRKVLIHRLAMVFAKPLKGSATELQIQSQMYQQEFTRAKAINASEDFGDLHGNACADIINGGRL